MSKNIDNTKYFQEEVIRWMNLFGLGRWSIRWEDWNTVATENPELRNACAAASIVLDDRRAEFAINPEIANSRSKEYVSRCALHEVTHVLTIRLENFATADVEQAHIDEESEAIAKAMERAFFGPVDM
jgi:uncharacterized protein YdaT